MENSEALKNPKNVGDEKKLEKKPFIISLTTLMTIVLFSSMLLFVLLLMFVETAKML